VRKAGLYAKKCFCCKVEKPYTLFFRHSQTEDGYHSWCKNCCTAGNVKSRAKQNSTIEGRANVFLRNAKIAAAKRKHPFTLVLSDIVECWSLQNSVCAYSGRKMTLESGRLNTVSIERIDSTKGYVPENTILVCQAINRMKSDFEYEDFYALCKDVVQFLGDDQLNLSVSAFK